MNREGQGPYDGPGDPDPPPGGHRTTLPPLRKLNSGSKNFLPSDG